MTDERLKLANAILGTYAPGCRLEYARGVYFAWTDYRGDPQRVRWVPRSRGSDYPSASRLLFSGTCTVATMELTRWVRGLPVRPLGMWAYFCSKSVGMNPEAARLAAESGWPVTVPCVMCGRHVGNGVGYDHYDHDGLKAPGPGCWYGEGCQARRPEGGAA